MGKRQRLAPTSRQQSSSAPFPPTASSRMRFAGDADTAVCPIARLRPDRDVDIPAERGEQAHQTFAGEVRKPAIEKRRYLRLIDAHEVRRCDLGQTPTLDRMPDVACKLGLGQLFLGIRKSQIGEHVAAARRHRDFGFSGLHRPPVVSSGGIVEIGGNRKLWLPKPFPRLPYSLRKTAFLLGSPFVLRTGAD